MYIYICRIKYAVAATLPLTGYRRQVCIKTNVHLRIAISCSRTQAVAKIEFGIDQCSTHFRMVNNTLQTLACIDEGMHMLTVSRSPIKTKCRVSRGAAGRGWAKHDRSNTSMFRCMLPSMRHTNGIEDWKHSTIWPAKLQRMRPRSRNSSFTMPYGVFAVRLCSPCVLRHTYHTSVTTPLASGAFADGVANSQHPPDADVIAGRSIQC